MFSLLRRTAAMFPVLISREKNSVSRDMFSSLSSCFSPHQFSTYNRKCAQRTENCNGTPCDSGTVCSSQIPTGKQSAKKTSEEAKDLSSREGSRHHAAERVDHSQIGDRDTSLTKTTEKLTEEMKLLTEIAYAQTKTNNP